MTIPAGPYFLAAESDRRRLPVLIVTGFLGSGKTTLINAWLRRPEMAGTAVAVNEFGEIPLDQHFLDSDPDATLVLANGCLCCSFSGDMEAAVMRLFAARPDPSRPLPKRLIIEPTGLADPAPIAQAILRNPMLSRVLRLESIATVVDALFADQTLERHGEARRQLCLADRIFVSKTELLPPGEAESLGVRLRRFNPTAPIALSTGEGADPAALPPGFVDPDAVTTAAPAEWPAPAEADHSPGLAALALTADRPLDWLKFDRWFRRIRLTFGAHILRVKGLLRVGGWRGPLALHAIHHVMHPPVAWPDWPDADRRTRLIFILQDLDQGILRAAWRDALAELEAAPVLDPMA